MNDCIFCKIITGEIPSEKVYEDEQILAFRDISPQAPIHILVIPKEHIGGANEITEENSFIVAKMLEKAKIIADEFHLDKGYRIVTNVGEHGCQSVHHLHFHILGGKQLSGKMV